MIACRCGGCGASHVSRFILRFDRIALFSNLIPNKKQSPRNFADGFFRLAIFANCSALNAHIPGTVTDNLKMHGGKLHFLQKHFRSKLSSAVAVG